MAKDREPKIKSRELLESLIGIHCSSIQQVINKLQNIGMSLMSLIIILFISHISLKQEMINIRNELLSNSLNVEMSFLKSEQNMFECAENNNKHIDEILVEIRNLLPEKKE